MKRTQVVDLLSTIRRTAVSFIAIAVFIALGLAFYGGSVWSVVHAEDSFTQTYRDGRVRTLLVTDPFGLTEAQVSELKTLDGVDDAEGLNIIYRFFENRSGVRQQAAVVQMTENIDILFHVEGRIPTASGETAVLRSWAEENNVEIGDVITLQEENGADYRSLQVVRETAQWDGEDLNALTFSADDPGYLADTNLTVTAIVDSAVYLSTNPYAHGICSTNGLYIDAVFFVSKEEMPPEAFGGYTSVALYNKELNRANCFSDQYKSRSEALSKDVQQLLDEWDRQLVSDFGESVNTLRAQLDTLSVYGGTVSADGEALYELLYELRQSLNTQESYSCVTETDTNNSFLTAENLIQVLNSLRSTLGITFLAIGVLICYSVVSRLVSDGAVQIGTRKALGFYRGEILRLYICYVGAAVLLGGIFGVLIGVFGIEYAFTNVFANLFTFTRIPLICRLKDILPVFLIVCGILFAVTVEACFSETAKSAVELLRGGQNLSGGKGLLRKLKVFRKLPPLRQAIIMNLFRDRRRVFGMITGIAGAAALIAAGLTLYINFTSAFTKQFRDYYRFDYQICFEASENTASDEIRDILEEHGLRFAEVYSSCFIMHTPDGKTNAPNVVVPADTEELAKLMYFDTDTDTMTAYESGLWMSEYYRYSYDAPVGSPVKLQTLDGDEAEIPIDRYYKHHLSTPVIVMDSDVYRDAFKDEPTPNAFYISSDGVDMDRLNDELKNIDGYIYTINFYDSFLDSFLIEKAVMLAFAALFILMAVLMALMTIINLLKVYISEKKNELIILMINGYSRGFAKQYIYYDTIILTLIGILTGLIAGSFMGNSTLGAIEGNSIRMIHGVSYISCAISAVVTAGLTALICTRTLREVDGFRLSDIDTGK